MKRKFTGDTYAAYRDCITTLNINPGKVTTQLTETNIFHTENFYILDLVQL